MQYELRFIAFLGKPVTNRQWNRRYPMAVKGEVAESFVGLRGDPGRDNLLEGRLVQPSSP